MAAAQIASTTDNLLGHVRVTRTKFHSALASLLLLSMTPLYAADSFTAALAFILRTWSMEKSCRKFSMSRVLFLVVEHNCVCINRVMEL
jgi:hypothetical protein